MHTLAGLRLVCGTYVNILQYLVHCTTPQCQCRAALGASCRHGCFGHNDSASHCSLRSLLRRAAVQDIAQQSDASEPAAGVPGAGLMQPRLMEDGQVCVDMGPPTLAPADVPTTLPATRDGTAVAAPLEVAGRSWTVTAVSMGNPHAVVYSSSDGPIKVGNIAQSRSL